MKLAHIPALAATAILLALPALAGEPGKKPPKTAKPEVLAEFKISIDGNMILVPVKIKGKEYKFWLDTGAAFCCVDPSLKKELGKSRGKKAIRTSGAGIKVDTYDPPEASLGKLNLKEGGPVICHDLRMFRLIAGRNIRGIVGMSLLRKYVVHADFDAGRLRILKPGRLPEFKHDLALELTSRRGVWEVSFPLSGKVRPRFDVDTGFNGELSVSRKSFDMLRKSGRLPKMTETVYAAASGVHRSVTSRIDTFRIGALRYRNLLVDRKETSGNLIGLKFLARHSVLLDFPKRKMYLKKGKNFDKVNEEDMSGLHLLRIKKQVVVYSVDRDSPAEKAGIRGNDVILTVGDRKAVGFGMWGLRRLLKSGDGKEIKMTLKRGAEEKPVRFKLKKRI